MSQNILILGATSTIAQALAHELAMQRHLLILAARDEQELDRLASDLRVRHGATVMSRAFDALDFGGYEALWKACMTDFEGGLDGVVVCHGYLGDQQQAQTDLAEARRIIDINYTSCASLLTLAAQEFEQRGHGFLCAISSVAGDRGRQSDSYGSAKAALSAFLQGLRARMFKSGVAVITIKPGFVDTKMTYGKEGMFLVAKPQQVARDIRIAIERRRNVVYTPWFWRWIMAIIKAIPEPIFKRMKL